MAITTLDGLVNALPGQYLAMIKNVNTVAATYNSLWTSAGTPGAPATPASGTNGELLTDATTGAIPFTNPVSGNTYLARAAFQSATSGIINIYDRLWQNITPIGATTLQSITQPALVRWDTGDDVELWIQSYSSPGATTPTMTISYTNSAGVSGRSTTITFPASMSPNRTVPVPLAAGDTGVRSVQSTQMSASIAGSPALGLVLRRRIATFLIPGTGTASAFGPFDLGLPIIPNDTCFEIVYFPTTTTNAVIVLGDLQLVQG